MTASAPAPSAPAAPPTGRRSLRPPSEDDFTSRLRSPAVAARIGLWLGISFGLCFLTGLISHYSQNASQPLPFPTHPSWGYRVTQALHVISGFAAVPLLLVKLWTVYPKLFQRMPRIGLSPRQLRELTVTGLERASIAVLVASAVFELVIGVQNAAEWYAWGFDFRKAHYALAWIVIGALLVHIAVKLPIIRDALRGDLEDTTHDRPSAVQQTGLSRRGLLNVTWAASGVAALTIAGGAVPYLSKVAIFAQRSGTDGHGGPPVNRAAVEAGTSEVRSLDYTLELSYAGTTKTLSYADLTAMPQSTQSLPIVCVEGWSAGATWTGVPVRALLDLVGAPHGKDVTVSSLEKSGSYAVSHLQNEFADDSRTLLALQLDGAPLSPDHGYPARLIAPDRPGVLQTKWVNHLEVLA